MTDTNDTTPTTPTTPPAAGAASGGPDSALTTGPRRVRVGTVIWGFILLGIAALFFAMARLDLSEVSPGVIAAWVVIGIGALAVVGGLIGAIVRRP